MKKLLAVTGAIVVVGSGLSPEASGEHTITSAGAASAAQACLVWEAADESGAATAVCGIQVDGAGIQSENDAAPDIASPFAVVVWWNRCGTQTDCTPYTRQAELSATDFSVAPDGSSASLSTMADGCAIDFDAHASPADPLDGWQVQPYGAAWPSDPEFESGANLSRTLMAEGNGTVCDDLLAQGTASAAAIWRVAGSRARRDNYGDDEFPQLAALADWTMQGFITDEMGNPIVGAKINNGRVQVETDSTGHYVFTDDMAAVADRFIAYASGYESETRTVTVVDAQQSVDFVLAAET